MLFAKVICVALTHLALDFTLSSDVADLGMGKGKIAAQCAHAALGSYKRALETRNPYLKQWMDQGQPKIVVKTDSEQSFLDLRKTAAAKDIMT